MKASSPPRPAKKGPQAVARQALFICGMHRSGTSLITNLFSSLGFHLGRTVSGPAEDNPTGFWENTKVVEVHERLLEELGSSWDDVLALPAGWERWPRTEVIRGQMATVLVTEFPRASDIIIKDPRCCRLLPLWTPIFEDWGFQPKILFPIRNPLEVAGSLARRNCFPLAKGLILWMRHVLDAEAASRHLPRAAISYTAVLADCRGALQQAADRLEVAWPTDETALAQAEMLMTDALRNVEVTIPDDQAEERLGRWGGRIYSALLQAERTGNWNTAVFDEVTRELSEFEAMVGPVVADARYRSHERIATLEAQAANATERLRQCEILSGENRSLREGNSQLLQAAESQAAQLVAVIEHYDHLVVEINSLRHELSDLYDQHTSLCASHTKTIEDYQRKEAAYGALQAQLDQTTTAHAEEIGRQALATEELKTALEAIHARARQLEQERDKARNQGKEAHEQAQALANQMENHSIVLANVTAELAAHEEAKLALSGQLAVLQQHADRLEQIVAVERYSMIKPAIRRLLRGGRRVSEVLPGGRLLRHWGFGLLGSLQPNHPRVQAYAEERRLGRLAASATFRASVPTASPSQVFEDPSYLFFPVIDWHFRIQRPQHLARELAASGHRVVYFSTTFTVPVMHEPSYRIIEEPENNLLLVQLSCPPPHPTIYQALATEEQRRHLAQAIQQMRSDLGLGELASVIHHPFWRGAAEALPANLVVYDCIDYHAGFGDNTESVLEEERKLLHSADLVTCTAARLQGILREQGRNSVLVRNGADVIFFANPPETLAFTKSRPVVGYFGAIAEWFDIDLVVKAARTYPGWDFVLVGAVHNCDVAMAKGLSNIRFFGERPYAELPSFLHGFDVCVIPFRITELTLCTNPVKVYEYMSAGKPVVATRMPEVMMIGESVYVGKDQEEFIAALNTAMVESSDADAARGRALWAADQSWGERAQVLSRAVKEASPKVSVIVLCYNNLAFTKGCLDSLYAYSWYSNWELVVVDNASTDGTSDWLKEFAADRNNVKLILNQENLGFAGGNNVGMEAADGEYMVLLNNDTYVSPGWILGLIRHFRLDTKLGLVGPVTNNIGNEAKIDICYADFSQLPAAAFAYTSIHAQRRYYVSNVAFFCVALSREVYTSVGGLDTAFRIGFFEDDDYCRRVRAAGYTIAIADDSFIHHHLSASFDALGSEEKRRIFEQNKAVYEAKWGPWQPHAYRRRTS